MTAAERLSTWKETYSHKIQPIEGSNNVKASGSASRQAQQTELAGGQDGSGASAVIGLSVSGGQGGAARAIIKSSFYQ
ncbi:hypothetical protein Tco_1258652, partial [Tanacetum coccineum]